MSVSMCSGFFHRERERERKREKERERERETLRETRVYYNM